MPGFSYLGPYRVFIGIAHEKPRIPLPFEEVMLHHERDMRCHLIRVSGDLDDAFDLFQEPWIGPDRAKSS